MATALENLVAARNSVAEKLVLHLASTKPSYGIDGQGVQWDAHYAMLSKQFEDLTKMIIQSDPYFLVSQVV